MPAATAKKSNKNNIKAKSVPVLKPAEILAWLQKHPSFFEEHKDSLGSLSLPKKGGNILSLHAAKAERTAEEHARLAIRQKQLIAMAQSNAMVAESLLNAMTGLIPVSTLADLRTYTQTGLRKNLDLAAVKLYLTGKTDNATTLTVATIEELAPQPATLRALELTTAESLYGPVGKKLKSDCLLPLYGIVKGKKKLLGLLALASEDPARFHAGQATTMASLFGNAVAACVGRIQSK